MEQHNTVSTPKWYDRTWLVIALCVFFFPVGLYALWKSNTIGQAGKLIGTAAIAGMLVYSANQPDKASDTSSVSEAPVKELTPAEKIAATKAEAAEERKEKVEKQFSAWNGSHRGVEKAIKARMNDPDSYEHVSTRFVDKGSYLSVMTQFRGKNAFGGKILNTAIAKVDFEGNVLDLQML